MIKPGDEVVTLGPLWHNGADVGGCLGVVIDTTGHILVNLYEYGNNPVKCFRREVELVQSRESAENLTDEIELAFDTIMLMP